MTKGLKNFLVILVTLIIVAGLCVGAFYIGKKVTKEPETQTEEEEQESGLVSPGEVEMNGIKITAATLSAPMYEAYGAPRGAEAALTLTVTPTPADAELTGAKFTMAFKNASSAWATGKTVTEYVTLSQSNERSATVSCLKAFGEPIVITYTVTGEKGESKSATYQLDYAKRIISVGIVQLFVRSGAVGYNKISGSDFGYSELNVADNYLSFNEQGGKSIIQYSDYTFDDEFTVADDTRFGLTESFSAACKSAGITPSHEKNGGSMTLEKIYVSDGSTNALTYYFGATAYKTEAFRNVVTEQNDGGVFELKLHLQGTYSEYTTTFTWGCNLNAFPKAVQSVQFADGSQHIF